MNQLIVSWYFADLSKDCFDRWFELKGSLHLSLAQFIHSKRKNQPNWSQYWRSISQRSIVVDLFYFLRQINLLNSDVLNTYGCDIDYSIYIDYISCWLYFDYTTLDYIWYQPWIKNNSYYLNIFYIHYQVKITSIYVNEILNKLKL